MSPTPPLTAGKKCDSTLTHQQDFNHSDKVPLVQPSVPVTNGHTEQEIKSVYFEAEEDKVKRGRPPKSSVRPQVANGTIKKRGRPPKVKTEDVPSKQSKITDTLKKTKRTVNRFKDVTKEELMERFLPDRIKHGLDILIIGINPGLFAAYKGHHYAGPGNHFWSCINMSGFVDRKMTSDDDTDLPNYGIGLSTIVQRTTPGAKDLSSKEIREGAKKLIEKIQFYKPKIAVFNGKGIYEIFSKEIFGQKKKDFTFGTQINRIPGTETRIYVMPSSSARCAQFPRAQDKVHFYVKLKQLRDEINGAKADEPICEVGYTFNLQKATELAKVQNIKQERFDPEYEANDASKNGNFPSYPVFSTAGNAGTSSVGAQGNSHVAMDVNNNNNAVLKTAPEEIHNEEIIKQADESSQQTPTKIMPGKVTDDNNVTARHAHLVRYLRQEPEEPGPSHGGKASGSRVIIPGTLSPGNPKLQEDVSEEQKQERVGNWVREQQCLEYDSEPPMGMERREEGAPAGQEGGVPPGVEIDGASQLSAISAGVSGSASESTSGYGSIDASSRRVRLDRVEMWVLEQQHVRRHNATNQQHIQQSINAASNVNHNHPPVTSQMQQHFQHNPSTTWQQIMTQANMGPIFAQALASQGHSNSNVARNPQRVSTTHASHVTLPNDQLPGPSGLVNSMPGGRNSPYGFSRNSRRDGGSGSSFGASVRPPVPLYSSWGGEESTSGGSAVSSPVVIFSSSQTTQPTPTQPFVNSNAGNNATQISNQQPTQAFHNVLPMPWQPSAPGSSLLAQNYNL